MSISSVRDYFGDTELPANSEWLQDFGKPKSLHIVSQLAYVSIIFVYFYLIIGYSVMIVLTFFTLPYIIVGNIIASIDVRHKVRGLLIRFLSINFLAIFAITSFVKIYFQKDMLHAYPSALVIATFCGAVSTLSCCVVYPFWRRHYQ